MAEHLQDPDESHCLKFFEAAVRFFRSTNFRSHQIMAEANIQRLPGRICFSRPFASFCVHRVHRCRELLVLGTINPVGAWNANTAIRHLQDGNWCVRNMGIWVAGS